MKLFQKSSWQQAPLLMLISLGLMILPISNSMGQVPLYMASAIWLVQVFRRKTTVDKVTWVLLLGWMLLILVSLGYAVHPELGIRKLSRFLIFPLVGAVTASCLKQRDRAGAMETIMKGLVVGVSALGIYDLFLFPIQMHGGTAFQDVGNMTSPQFFLVGLMCWLGLMSVDRVRLHKAWWLCLPLLLAGLLLHQKRGVWLASVITIGLWTLWSRKWKTLSFMVLMVGCSLFIPQVRIRLGELKQVVQPTHGGRMVLWTQVAPRLLPEYPWGMGYNGSKYEDFEAVLPDGVHMEAGLRHLHNNLLQIRLELGWLGSGWWCLWMGLVFYKAFRPGPPEIAVLRGAVAFAFLGLFLNGLVEYNFGDSEILKIYLVIFGLIDVAGGMVKSNSAAEGDRV
ncbi:O-antigen ligase family protein [Kiritimatiellota bacterium B12222]|nr:O-antigen ligase family protein [Kiritimatiellota bacterium B12222]